MQNVIGKEIVLGDLIEKFLKFEEKTLLGILSLSVKKHAETFYRSLFVLVITWFVGLLRINCPRKI